MINQQCIAPSTVISYRKQSGFTLLEIMIVVVIIGLLAVIAIPGFNKAKVTAQNSRLANDLRIFAGQIDVFALETGDYPEDANTGDLPDGLEEYIRVADWEKGPSIGGEFDVEKNDNGVASGVGVVGYNVSNEQLAKFEQSYDDGDFSTGIYQKISANRFYYVLEEE